MTGAALLDGAQVNKSLSPLSRDSGSLWGGLGGGEHLWGPHFTYLTGQEKL